MSQVRAIRTMASKVEPVPVAYREDLANCSFSYYRVPAWERREDGTTSSPFAIDFAFTASPDAVIERHGRPAENRSIPAMTGGAVGPEPFDWLRIPHATEFVELRPGTELLGAVADHYRRPPDEPFVETYGNDEPFLFALAMRLRAHALGGEPIGDLEADALAMLAIEHTIERDGGMPARRSGARLDERRWARVREYLHAHLAEPVTLADLADEAAVSRHHFAVMFRRTTGLTPHGYLTALRMQRAHLLLREGTSVAMAAQSVGYAPGHQFRKAFHRWLGNSPGQVAAIV